MARLKVNVEEFGKACTKLFESGEALELAGKQLGSSYERLTDEQVWVGPDATLFSGTFETAHEDFGAAAVRVRKQGERMKKAATAYRTMLDIINSIVEA